MHRGWAACAVVQLLLLLLNGFSVVRSTTPEAPTVPFLIAFGDSLTDTKNAFNATMGLVPFPPQFYTAAPGRNTNGKVYVELLAQALQAQLVNFAVIGATACPTNSTIPSFREQVGIFANNTQAVSLLPNALVVVYIGANDYLNAVPQALLTGQAVEVLATTWKVVTCIIRGVLSLIELGATKILLIGQSGLDINPFSLALNATSQGLSGAWFTELQEIHNKLLTEYAAYLQYDAKNPAQVVFINPTPFTSSLVGAPELFQITETTKSCLTFDNILAGTFEANVTAVCDNPDAFAFYDRVHPSAAAHTFLAEFFLEQATPMLKAGTDLP